MFEKLRIGQRLVALIVVQAVVLLFVGLIALHGLRSGTQTTQALDQAVNAAARLTALVEPLRSGVSDTALRLAQGTLDWPTAEARLARAAERFERAWREAVDGLAPLDRRVFEAMVGPHRPDVQRALERLEGIVAARDEAALQTFVAEDLDGAVLPFVASVQASIAEQEQGSRLLLADAQQRERSILVITLVAFLGGIFLSAMLGLVIYQSIAAPIRSISATLRRVAEGDLTARSGLAGEDELAVLGRALDDLLAEKLELLERTERENRVLNDSIIALLRAVSLLSQRDLTIHLPVTEDVTGPLADAINKLTRDTSRVLAKVTEVAERVEAASRRVDDKANLVKRVAMNQQAALAETAEQLARAGAELAAIAQEARQCDRIAEQAGEATEQAAASVADTLDGMNAIRETINEAGKRIKRLGERSQEISTVVDLIKDIAERTHVLALNSSVQAAAAGEAGRGFAVIAEEVQRLAENSKRATGEIAALVKNIQIETNDTMSTMERTIGYVVDGSRRAESAVRRMQDTRRITGELIQAVRRIAEGTERQVDIAGRLRERAEAIIQSSEETRRELDEQLDQTRHLTDFCEQLIGSVKIFKLPDDIGKAA